MIRTKNDFTKLCKMQRLALIDPNPVLFAAVSEATMEWSHLADVDVIFQAKIKYSMAKCRGSEYVFSINQYKARMPVILFFRLCSIRGHVHKHKKK